MTDTFTVNADIEVCFSETNEKRLGAFTIFHQKLSNIETGYKMSLGFTHLHCSKKVYAAITRPIEEYDDGFKTKLLYNTIAKVARQFIASPREIAISKWIYEFHDLLPDLPKAKMDVTIEVALSGTLAKESDKVSIYRFRSKAARDLFILFHGGRECIYV